MLQNVDDKKCMRAPAYVSIMQWYTGHRGKCPGEVHWETSHTDHNGKCSLNAKQKVSCHLAKRNNSTVLLLNANLYYRHLQRTTKTKTFCVP